MKPALVLLFVASCTWADTRCASCHKSIVDSYGKTGMGRSVSIPTAEVQLNRQWIHDYSGRRMGVEWKNGKMLHSMEIGRHVETYEMAYAVGSGKEGKTYLHRIADSLFESPLTWYSGRGIWDMSPGYAVDPNPNFYRPITSECLVCHSGNPRPIAGTQNRYQDPPLDPAPIGCDRCHGNPEQHLKDARRGNIVNPASLPQAKRDSVCESCHLSGEARITNPGREFSDFRPGMQLEEVFSVYVPKKSGADTVLKVVSHSEQMAASKCAIESGGKLWCATCHDPHKEQDEKTRGGWYRDKCLGCHTTPAITEHRQQKGEDCARCHMPRTGSYDGGHTAFTDHWIRTPKSEEKFRDRGELLRPWREPPAEFQTRNLALAYISNVQRSRSQKRTSEAVRLLNDLLRERKIDGTLATVVGLQFLGQRAAPKALPFFKAAAEEHPENSLRRLNYAAALAGAGQKEAAKREAEEAIRLEPLLEEAYALLAEIEPTNAAHWKGEYRKVAPKRFVP